ncbi:hypothetical protein ScalyP_jg1921 [Parmales sp. scaly parma]|nr:hypothetical protein ScalyP_jg1921 [Parmales sp. scaly parma]
MTSCPTPTWLTDNGFIALSQQKENDPNSCFILSDEANFDYLECVDKCAMANGTIASVGSFAEERMLKRRTFNGHFIMGDGQFFWLGGYKSSLTDVFLWQDGSDWTYDHWFPGEPNGGANQLCVGFHTGADGMVDHPCSYELQCMCSTNTALSDDFRQFGRQDIIDSSQNVGGSSATIGTVNGAVLLCVLLNFVLSRCMRSSAVKPGAPRRDSIRTTVSAVLEGGGDNIPFPFADFLLMRGSDLQSEILQIVNQEKLLEGETIQTTVSLDELVERNAKSMALSNSSVPTYSIILTLVVGAGFCLMVLNQFLPYIQIGDPFGIVFLLLVGPLLLFMLKLTADLISLLATLGQRYNHLVSSFAGDENCISCKKRYDDPMALRSMFDNIERKKEHVWVLFSHPLDDTLVWGILTYLGVSLLILWVSGM